MCGINIIVDKTGKLDDSNIKRMNASTEHRGPDHSGINVFRNPSFTIFLGNNRLKVTDPLARADQPMVSADNKYAISYNGEVYNFNALKSRLQNFHFKSESDTEAVFYSLIRNGVDAAGDFQGMFAFAFYDHQNEKVTFCRDERGIKPFYYYQDERYFIASSEIKGILSSGLVNKELNDKELFHYLQFKYALRPATFYKGIYELEPGNYLQLSNEFKVESGSYKKSLENPLQNIRQLRDSKLISISETLLINAISAQSYTEGKSGIFLSGGVDSTLMLALSKELFGAGIPTFSIVNSKEEAWAGTDDFEYSRLAAKKYSSSHTEIEVSSADLGRLDEIIRKLDQPIADSALLMTYLISENASRNMKVIMSGAGADEVFAGYNRHKAYQIYLKYFRNSSFIQAGRLLSELNYFYKSKKWRLVNRFLGDIDSDPQETFFNFSNLKFRDIFRPVEFREVWKNGDLLDSAIRHDKNFYLVNDVLALTDQMTMSYCLEARVPYLDKSLVEWTESLGANILLKKGPKWILRDLLSKRDGSAFVHRKKEGFGLPLKSWFSKNEGEQMLKALKEKNQTLYRYFPYYKVDQMIDLQNRRWADYSAELWALIVLSRWLKHNFE